ncbi:MAG: 50S ribosomal protein L20 [Bacteroidetes bacterium]|nr:MAG: 50S ribosomal protein L20 [Bacteroidota bacterium]
MPRSVNTVASRQRRKKVLKLVKGQFGRRKNVWTVAKNAYEKGQTYAFRDRRNKKRSFRALWIQRINAATRLYDMSYSEFMGKVHKKNIEINRKTLADLAMNHPDAFKAIVDAVK